MNADPASGLRTEPLTASDRRHLLWAAPPLVVLLVANLLFELTGGGYARVAAELLMATAGNDDAARLGVDATAAITWATLALVYLCVSVGAAVGAWRIIGERVVGRARRPFTAMIVAITAIGLLHLAAVDILEAPLRAIFAVTRDALLLSPANRSLPVAVIIVVVTFINVISVFVPALLITAAAAASLPPVAGWNETTLVRRASQVRRFVAFAAAFMVAGVLHMGAWTHWAGATLAEDADVALARVAATVTVFWGATFTLMIASYYLPVSIRIGSLAEAIMDRTGVAIGDRHKWLADRGLSVHLSEQLPQVAAMAAPLLAGPLSATIGSLADTVAP